MSKKRIIEGGIICLLLLLLAAYVEKTEQNITGKNQIIRGSPGTASDQVELTLDAGDIVKKYQYDLVIPARNVTEKQADECFSRAKKEIDKGFFSDGETAEHVTMPVHMKQNYVNKLVKAEWNLDQYRVVDIEGNMIEDAIGTDGELVQASVELSCGEYKQEYSFPFKVYQPLLSKKDQLLKDIGTAIENEGEKKGSRYLTLPNQVNGIPLKWQEKKQHLVWKLLFFEILVIVLLFFVFAEKKRTYVKKRKEQMRMDYSDVVNKTLILLGAGMTLKQAWNRISAQYYEKRDKKSIEKRHIYEEMMITNREICDGESEKKAYQNFAERTDLGEYQRFIRILVQNVHTGSRGLCEILAKEAENALEEKKALARKLGEEVGTKMLLPLMMMLGIVISIIMVPAMLSFKV